MEEGPEPQEFVERSVEHHHHAQEHAEHDDGRRRDMMISAITSAVLAVMAAFGSLLSGHAANQAILNQTKASDQWAYFQSKSTKGHLYEVGRQIVTDLAALQGPDGGDKASRALERYGAQVDKYAEEKKEIEDKARELEKESDHEFRKHHDFAMGIASFQVGIVLASISILVRYRAIWVLSLVGGAVGLVFLCLGLVH